MQGLEFKILDDLRGALSETEHLQVRQWVDSSSENQRIYQEIEKIYLASEVNTDHFQPDIDKAWHAVSSAIQPQGITATNILLRWAAVITLIIGVGVAVFQIQNQQAPYLVQTIAGEVKHLELADGSSVWLNENTVLSYDKQMNGDVREVSLEGQAFFDIAKDKGGRPFRIVGKQTTVEVLGTSFDLITRANYANVNVTSGRVAFSLIDDSDIKVVLEKGQQATFEDHTLIKNDTFNENATAWMTKDFVFKSTPLSHVVAELSEHFNVKIKVDDTIKNCLITSAFEDKELDEILELLKAMANISSEKKGKTIKLTGPGC